MATDKKFLAKVNENMLSRLLNAFVWKAKELDAFYTFTSFIQHSCPLYVQPALEGVHCGLKLLDKCLKVADPHLFRYLRSKKLVGKLYAFPSVMTLCACTPPLQELLMLWDFYFAYGVHLNILCIVAQLILMRDDLMNAPSPMRLLRNFPDLNTRAIIPVTLSLIPQLPEDLYDMLVRHPFDPMVYDLIMTDQDVAPGGGVGGQENEDEDEDDDL
ncbi:hypothetical protein HK102_006437 [Quaeritorhiza haematococci]|nr:hypothetical protein HK102_006437 [Quaeritorhiza haematococci]